MATVAVKILEHHVGPRVDSDTIILVVDSGTVNVQSVSARDIECVSVVAERIAITVQSVACAVVKKQVADRHISASSNLEQMRGPVLDLDLREAAALHVAELDEMVGLVSATVGALTIPVIGAGTVNDRTRQTSDLSIRAFENDGRVAGVRSVLDRHGPGEKESAISGNLD